MHDGRGYGGKSNAISYQKLAITEEKKRMMNKNRWRHT